MIIIHKIEDFLLELFPKYKASRDVSTLKEELENYYTQGPFKPAVEIEGDHVTIKIDTPKISTLQPDYRKAIALCEKGDYKQAKPILADLIKKDPTNSEFYRIHGQILSDEGDQDEAINSLIDSLRWDPKNGYALVMMGNIFARDKDDLETAMKYYDQALHANPKDNIAINNIGGNLLQQGKTEAAKKYFWDAMKIDPTYPNTHYALSMIAGMENDWSSAFFSAIETIKHSKQKDILYRNALEDAVKISRAIADSYKGKELVKEYAQKLSQEAGKPVVFEPATDIPTAAKLEVAENYDRPEHLVRYNPKYPAGEHLQMHELVHLDFIAQARKAGINQLFTSTQVHKRAFIRSLEPSLKKLSKRGISDESLARYAEELFDGLNRQILNTPIDLFIEDFLYYEYPELRPYQFLSLHTIVTEGLQAVTDKKIVELSPRDVLSKSKIYNIVTALEFFELYGINMVSDFKATPLEMTQAKKFFDEFKEYKGDRQPGEEYELVAHWAEDLQLQGNFELVDENEYRNKRTNVDNLLASIENDPYDIYSTDPQKKRDMETFQKSQAELGTNMAVVMFMVDALQYFEKVPKSKVREIAMEIATVGTQGIRPNEKYILSNIPGKEFSGYHLLAYYYTSWAIAIPEMVKELQLPFDKEFMMAKSLHQGDPK